MSIFKQILYVALATAIILGLIVALMMSHDVACASKAKKLGFVAYDYDPLAGGCFVKTDAGKWVPLDSILWTE